MAELSAALGRELAPRQVLLDPAVPDGYVRDWVVPGTTPDRHLGYAVQWFAFAALAAAIWFVLSFAKIRRGALSPADDARRRGRRQFLLVASLFIVPVVTAHRASTAPWTGAPS